MELVSTRATFEDEHAVVEHYWEKEWTDGLPIVPPTPQRVQAFLDYARLEADAIIGTYTIRATALTAEKVAINAVMAGCRPEYMPVVVAAFEGLTDSAYRMNHMASLGSPWPLAIVNGPVIKELGMNSGQYAVGPTSNRANSTIGRAISLGMINCFGAKVGGVQRGTMGNPHKWSFLAAENEDTPWTPLHVQRGFKAEDSTVTMFGSMEGLAQFVTPNFQDPASLLELVCQKVANGFFTIGSHVVLMAPTFQQAFLDAGMTKDNVTDYLMKNVRRDVRSLKIDGRYRRYSFLGNTAIPVEPGDENRMVYLGHNEADRENYHDAEWDRKMDYLIVVCGGEAGNFGAYLGPYPLGTQPVTKRVNI